MSPQLTQLLALVPEAQHAEFIRRLPAEAVTALAEDAAVDESTLSVIAEAVWQCLEE